MPKMKSYASFDDYLADQSTTNQAIIRALRKFVKRTAPALAEAVKWGNGCWIGQSGAVAYVYSAPDHVQFGLFRGAQLEDPKGLLEGKGAYVRHTKLRAVSDIDGRALAALLKQAARQSASILTPRTSKAAVPHRLLSRRRTRRPKTAALRPRQPSK